MASYNKVVLMGNLTRDPESRPVRDGMPMTTFRLAVNRTYMGRDNERKEEVAFVNVSTFGKTAEVVHQYLRRGRCVLVDGRLKQFTWQDESGKDRSSLSVTAENVQFLPRGGGANGGGTHGGDAPAEAVEATAEPF